MKFLALRLSDKRWVIRYPARPPLPGRLAGPAGFVPVVSGYYAIYLLFFMKNPLPGALGLFLLAVATGSLPHCAQAQTPPLL